MKKKFSEKVQFKERYLKLLFPKKGGGCAKTPVCITKNYCLMHPYLFSLFLVLFLASTWFYLGVVVQQFPLQILARFKRSLPLGSV